MAKIGEGDARWIVAEREDGANVSVAVSIRLLSTILVL